METPRVQPPPRRTTTPTFLVVAKAPVPGAVKTRLTPAYSDHEAAALAAAALLDTLDAVRLAVGPSSDGARVVVALAGELAAAAAPEALRAALADVTVIDQRGRGLAARLVNAHRDAGGEFGATVQIGMDTPQVDPAALASAAALVTDEDGPDAALGLAEDGGWWLLALRRGGDARHIAAVPTSMPQTGQLTRVALQRAGLQVVLLGVLRDVDEPRDVGLVAEEAPGTRFAALADTLGPRR